MSYEVRQRWGVLTLTRDCYSVALLAWAHGTLLPPVARSGTPQVSAA